MRLWTAALAVAAIGSFADRSSAAFTTHMDALTADVDARIAAFTGTLTKQQKTDKAHLTALSKTLHKKSTTLATDLKVAAAAAKIVDKSFSADATLPGELAAALDGFHADVLNGRNVLAAMLGLPLKDGKTGAATKDLDKTDTSLDAFVKATKAANKAGSLVKAQAAVAAGERVAPLPMMVAPLEVDFGVLELGADAPPQTITITNVAAAIYDLEVAVDFVQSSKNDGFSVPQGGLTPIPIHPDAPLQIALHFKGTKPGGYVGTAVCIMDAVNLDAAADSPRIALDARIIKVRCKAVVKGVVGVTKYGGPLIPTFGSSGGNDVAYYFDGSLVNDTAAAVAAIIEVTVDGVTFGGDPQSVVVPAKNGTTNGERPIFRGGPIKAGKHTVKLLIDGKVAKTISVDVPHKQ